MSFWKRGKKQNHRESRSCLALDTLHPAPSLLHSSRSVNIHLMSESLSTELPAPLTGVCGHWQGLQSLLMRGFPCFAVIKSPPGWELGVYTAGALALLGIAAVSLWKLWTSGSFPSPSPFPNYDYRYLQQKYGETYAEARQKVRLRLSWVHHPLSG